MVPLLRRFVTFLVDQPGFAPHGRLLYSTAGWTALCESAFRLPY